MISEYKIMVDLLDKNTYSRPGSAMKGIRGLGIHWVGNANSKAINNRNYFNNLSISNKTRVAKGEKAIYASSHEIIGLDGEVIICVPKNEVAYHVGANSYKQRANQLLDRSPNRYLYGIEVCHPDWGGKFNSKTYKVLINRCADLLIEFDLKPSKDTLWRHYDVTGKDCPHYYIKNPNEWDRLVSDITKVYDMKIRGMMEEEITMKLKEWQVEMGEESIDSLVEKGLINDPDMWKKSLGEPTPQYLFWGILDRILKSNKK